MALNHPKLLQNERRRRKRTRVAYLIFFSSFIKKEIGHNKKPSKKPHEPFSQTFFVPLWLPFFFVRS